MTMNHKHMRHHRSQAGATLIEILVSILVIAFGVLAMATLQSNAIKHQKTTEYRAIATLLASDLAERMRANLQAAKAGQYAWTNSTYTVLTEDLAKAGNPSCGSVTTTKDDATNKTSSAVSACSADDMAKKDLVEWRLRALNSLPQVSGHISAVSQNTVDIWIAWVDPENKDSSGNTAAQDTECPQTWSKPTGTPNYSCISMKVAL
jgi:type IV pilus assembly protein PilV